MTTSMRTTSRSTRRAAAAGAAVLLALGLGLAGCTGGDDGASSDDGSGGSLAAPKAQQGGAPSVADESGAAGGGDSSGGSSTRTSARVLPDDGRDIVYTGAITVRVPDVATAARRVETMTLAMGGIVFSEQTTQLPGGRRLGEADLSLRVPPAEFSSTLDRVGGLGKELSRSRSARDVTTELADIDSRVRSQERSVARVRSLLAEAETIGEVVQIESELAQREADLESLQAQLARLKDVTDLATVEVTLLAREVPRPYRADDEDFGFLVGLRGGLSALVGIVVVGLTVLGALLPFALVAGLVGWPAYLLVRRARRNRAPIMPSN
jgi:hypothetical protein